MPKTLTIDVDSFYRELGARLRELREERGLKQVEIAHVLGLTRTSVANIERGRQKLPAHALYLIADSFGADIAELLPPQRSDDERLKKMVSECDFSPEAAEWIISTVGSLSTT